MCEGREDVLEKLNEANCVCVIELLHMCEAEFEKAQKAERGLSRTAFIRSAHLGENVLQRVTPHNTKAHISCQSTRPGPGACVCLSVRERLAVKLQCVYEKCVWVSAFRACVCALHQTTAKRVNSWIW